MTESIRNLPEEERVKLEGVQLGSTAEQGQAADIHEKIGNFPGEEIRNRSGAELEFKGISLEILADKIGRLEEKLATQAPSQPGWERSYIYQGLGRLNSTELYSLIKNVDEAEKILEVDGDASRSAYVLHNPLLEKLQLELPHADKNVRYEETFERIRVRIKNEILESREGLNIGQVLNYFERNNFPIRDYLIIDELEVPKLNRILSTVGMNNALEGSGQGAWYPDLQLAVVVRRAEIESVNGSYSTEHYLAHEIAHGALRFEVNRKEWGHFFDEGSVQMIAEDCSEQNLKSGELPPLFRIWQKESSGINLNQELSRAEISNRTVTMTAELEKGERFTYTTSLSANLFIYNRDTAELSYSLHVPAIAAYGLKLLFGVIPGLQNEFRKSPVDVKAVRALIDAEDSELFEELNALEYSADSFAKGQKIILDRFYEPEHETM